MLDRYVDRTSDLLWLPVCVDFFFFFH